MNVSEELTALRASIDGYDEHIVSMSTDLACLKAKRLALVARQRHLCGLVADAVALVPTSSGSLPDVEAEGWMDVGQPVVPDDVDVWELDQYNSDVELTYRVDVSSWG